MTATRDWVSQRTGPFPGRDWPGNRLGAHAEADRYLPQNRFCGQPTKPGYPCRNWKTRATDRCYLHPETAHE
jgi:hypothetical protein